MFFTELEPFLATCSSLSITMKKADDGKISLAVLPVYKDNKTLLPPVIMTGTAQQLDEGFTKEWAKTDAATGIMSNIAGFISTAKTVEKKEAAKTTGTSTATSTAKKPETSKTGNGSKAGTNTGAVVDTNLFKDDADKNDEEQDEVKEEVKEETKEPELKKPEPVKQEPVKQVPATTAPPEEDPNSIF